MIVTFETSEDESTLDMQPEWPIPRLHEYIDWQLTGVKQLPVGIYRVEQVTHTFAHGTMRVRLGLALTQPTL